MTTAQPQPTHDDVLGTIAIEELDRGFAAVLDAVGSLSESEREELDQLTVRALLAQDALVVGIGLLEQEDPEDAIRYLQIALNHGDTQARSLLEHCKQMLSTSVASLRTRTEEVAATSHEAVQMRDDVHQEPATILTVSQVEERKIESGASARGMRTLEQSQSQEQDFTRTAASALPSRSNQLSDWEAACMEMNNSAVATALYPASHNEVRKRRTYARRSAADRRAERRERLLEAGLALFGTDGYALSSIEKLCTHASVSTRNFYEEFHSREDLLIALHSRVNERAYRAVTAAFADHADAALAQRFDLAMRSLIHTMAADPRWAHVAYVETIGVSNAVEKHRLAWHARWSDLMVAEANRAVRRGEAAPRDFTLAARSVIATINDLVHHYSHNRGRITLDEVIAEIVRQAVAAVTVP